MECTEFRPQYIGLVGGRLSDELAGVSESHLAECASCQSWVREGEELRDRLRNRVVPYYTAPASLKREIEAKRERPTRTWWPQALTAALATAMAMVLLFLPVLPRRTPIEGLQAVLPALIDEHIRSSLRTRWSEGEEESVNAFFQLRSEMGIRSSLFYTGDDEMRLLKAQPTYLRNLQGMALLYEEPDGHKVSYLLLRNGQGNFRAPDTGRVQIDRFRPYLVRSEGFALLAWRSGEWSVFLISDMVSDYDIEQFKRFFLKVRTAAESTLY